MPDRRLRFGRLVSGPFSRGLAGTGGGGGRRRWHSTGGGPFAGPAFAPFAWRTGVTSPRRGFTRASGRSILVPWSGPGVGVSSAGRIGGDRCGWLTDPSRRVSSHDVGAASSNEPSGRPVSVFSSPHRAARAGPRVGGKGVFPTASYEGRSGRWMPWVSITTRRQKPSGCSSLAMRSWPPGIDRHLRWRTVQVACAAAASSSGAAARPRPWGAR